MSGLTLQSAAAATNAQVRDASRFPGVLRVVTDTRSIEPGDTFLALRGERFDGHAFVSQALERGAAAVIVDDAKAVPEDGPALVVSDTKLAYMHLAAAARAQFHGRVIAITGSAGKTTTKHLLAQLLAAHYGESRVLATPGNENNEIGVSKLLLGVQPEHDVLVVEMGARHAGEIAELVAIAHPEIGVLTNIGEAHLEIFGSREVLASTKWGLFSGGARAVLNARDAESNRRAATLQAAPLWYGSGEPDRPGVWVVDERTIVLSHEHPPQTISVSLQIPGEHNRSNLAGAVAAALAAGVPADAIARCVPSLTLPAGRYENVEIPGGARLIYDAYNANASGMMAALDAFAAESARQRVAVLASMAELGSQAAQLHERVGAHAAATHVDALLVGGEYADSLAAGALAAGFPQDRIVPFESNAQAAQWLREHVGPRDAVLVKGSRKYKMEEIVLALQSAASERA